ncbi:hypothetical protein HDU88_005450 [Geranomyces variabilis]|nr:hypothetical protein HDU88_005450 [Geranomyces variabilis]
MTPASRDSATVTPQHVPSFATPAKPAQSDDVVPSTDAELDTACGELAAMHVDVAGADNGGMLRKLLHHTSKKRIVEANGAEFLAFNKCLLLATSMPSAFAAAGVPRDVWSQVRRAFGRRALELKPEIAEHSLRRLVNQWHDEINDGATIFAPEIHRKNEAAVRLLSCVVNLSQSLRLDDAPNVLVADPELEFLINNATTYSIKRPDIQIVMGERVTLCAEVKRKGSKATDMKKDQSRVIMSAVHHLKEDAARYESAENPVRLALWCPGEEVFAYEVVSYPCGLFIAAEIARFTLPTAIRPSTISQISEAIGWFAAIAERVGHIKRRMQAEVARPGMLPAAVVIEDD